MRSVPQVALAASVSVPDDDCEMFVEKDSYYAVKDEAQETGFLILHCSSITYRTISGMALVPGQEETKYFHLQVIFYIWTNMHFMTQ